MDSTVYDLSRARWLKAVGYDDLEKDDDGFVVLKPTADRVDHRINSLTTNISDLESKLKQFRAEKAAAQQYTKTDEYREDKAKSKKKKEKKKRDQLLSMVFNAADQSEVDDEDEENYKDLKKKGGKRESKKDAPTTLETQYGKRYASVVSMLYDSMADFDRIAKDIDEELNSAKGQVRNMYRGQQVANLLSALDKKASMVKEIGRIADKVTDYEYKVGKDKKENEKGDTSKAIANLGAKYLRGTLFDDDEDSGKKGGKKGKKKGSESSFSKQSKRMSYDDDDDIEDVAKSKKRTKDDEELATALAQELMSRKGEFSFTAHERAIAIEGTYTFAIQCDPLDPDGTWKMVALDKKGKLIKGFKEEHGDLFPKKKNMKLRFDINKGKAYDSNSGKSYKLLLTD